MLKVNDDYALTNLLVGAKGDSTASKIPRYLRHACIAGERGGGIFSTKEHPARPLLQNFILPFVPFSSPAD